MYFVRVRQRRGLGEKWKKRKKEFASSPPSTHTQVGFNLKYNFPNNLKKNAIRKKGFVSQVRLAQIVWTPPSPTDRLRVRVIPKDNWWEHYLFSSGMGAKKYIKRGEKH